MTVLVAGGHAAVQRSIAAALVAAGCDVRVLGSTEAQRDAWPGAVEPWYRGPGGRDAAALLEGCDAAVIIDSGIGRASHRSADSDVESVMPLVQAIVAGGAVRRLLMVVDQPRTRVGAAAVEQLSADLARSFTGTSQILEAAPVYGTGDDVVSRFLVLMRSLPAVPLTSDAQVQWPVWRDDLARAVSECVLQETPRSGVITVRGPEPVTAVQLYELIAQLTERRPLRIPVPVGARLDAVSDDSEPDGPRTGDIGRLVTDTPLSDGLKRAILQLPELTVAQGIGRVHIKRIAVHIAGSAYTPSQLLQAFRARFRDLMPIPIGVEPAAGQVTLDEGAVLTMALPGRGHVSVRVETVTDDQVTVATLRGHVLAGFVRFSTAALADRVIFEVMPCDSAANVFDWISRALGGARIQDANWTTLARNVAAMAGRAVEMEFESKTLTAVEAAAADEWISNIIRKRQQREQAA